MAYRNSGELAATDSYSDSYLADISNLNPKTYITAGTREYKNAGLALFFVGFASFSMIYCVQPLLPSFAKSFAISPAQSSLALSLTTGFLALSIFIMGAVSQMFARKNMIFISMLMGALLNLAAAIVPHGHELLVARALEGFVLGGVPAVAMAYIAEEISPQSLGKSMGLYIAGNGFGAMVGRVGMGVLSEFTSWRIAMLIMGLLCVVSAFAFLLLLPKSRNFVRDKRMDIKIHLKAWAGHLANLSLIRIYFVGFALTGVFVTLFNYSTFRLSGAPFLYSPTQISMLFLTFGFGIISSSLAGVLGDKYGRKTLLLSGFALMITGIMVTLITSLWAIIAGIILITTGFFLGHSAASSAIGVIARTHKGHASSLYLLFYYCGSSIIGSVGGIFWARGGWGAVAALSFGLSLVALMVIAGLKLNRAQ